jgi:NADPH:quinone reductase-like Zn-dependent oxidoreductase
MSRWEGQRIQSLVTTEGEVNLSLAQGEVGDPGPDEVIVRVEAAPINPSDLGLMFAFGELGRATFAGTPESPVVSVPLSRGALALAQARLGRPVPVGNEGAGTVVAAGASEAAQGLDGHLVAARGGGFYSQYRRVKAADCLLLPDGAEAADGASAYVNPMTAQGMLETMRDEGHRGLVHTAAASGLGHMLVRLCAVDSVPLVNIVRSPAQVALLEEAGAEHVLDSSAEGFDAHLVETLKQTGATLAFDATAGGALADRILTAMDAALSDGADFDIYGSPVHKQVYLYGSLDRSATELRRTYGMSWGVGGWLMPRFLERVGAERVARMRARVAAELTTTFATTYTDRVTLAEALTPEAVGAYVPPRTGTKFLVTPNA